MRKLLVATHGRFASGIMETFKLIMGENEDISEISAYVEPGLDMKKEAEKKIHELNEDDELIIVADIMGGSIANTFSSYIQSEKIHIITGLNLPLLIGLAQDLDSDVSTDELIENAIQMGREGIVDLKKMIEENEKGILEKIKGIILLSLVDIPLAIQVYLKDDFPVMVTYAKNMKREKMENQLMPAESFIHPISVKTFLRYAIENKDIDFAKFSDKNYNFEELNNIKVPLFMRWGNQRELIIQEADKLCEQLKGKIKNDKLDIGYIDGADHSYTGKEEILANEIQNFLKD